MRNDWSPPPYLAQLLIYSPAFQIQLKIYRFHQFNSQRQEIFYCVPSVSTEHVIVASLQDSPCGSSPLCSPLPHCIGPTHITTLFPHFHVSNPWVAWHRQNNYPLAANRRGSITHQKTLGWRVAEHDSDSGLCGSRSRVTVMRLAQSYLLCLLVQARGLLHISRVPRHRRLCSSCSICWFSFPSSSCPPVPLPKIPFI